MKLMHALNRMKELNSGSIDPYVEAVEHWQYVLHSLTDNSHWLLIPTDREDRLELDETPLGRDGHTDRMVILTDNLPETQLNGFDWEIWKWLPDDDRRLFSPAMETMIQ